MDSSSQILSMVTFILLVVLVLVIVLLWTSSPTQILSNSGTASTYMMNSSATNILAEGGGVFQLVMIPRAKGSMVRITNLQLDGATNQPLLVTYDNSIDHSSYSPNDYIANGVTFGWDSPEVVAPNTQYSAPEGGLTNGSPPPTKYSWPQLPAGTTTTCLNTDGNSQQGSWVCTQPLSVLVQPST